MTGGERERYNRLQYVSEEPGRGREITGRKNSTSFMPNFEKGR